MQEPTQEPGKNEAKKILLLGLDNAGKTSIVNLVIKKISNVVSITPTKGLNWSEAEIFGQKIVLHDLGGQKKYRKKYIENQTYFESTDAMIFVIDLQDRERYDTALEYFDKALKIDPKFTYALQAKTMLTQEMNAMNEDPSEERDNEESDEEKK